jgi:peroxiredoxin
LYAQFKQLEVDVIAVSFAEPNENKKWIDDQGYQYEVWTDTERTLASTYGAVTSETQGFPSRVTKIVDADGVLILEYNDASFLRNPQYVLEDCKALFKD